ncbi:Tetratricopeptide repeat protein 17 [Eumeta japonica]|uniref:Tetratricopeptide repeat protein 17 n=1 Tax=Eumeta variegata TaxID=151549 RepID=A0A4C1VZD2_EUMVA|nr:Tetratricopeptide repeat protein 17 [Eumeta japonica]
MFVPRLVDKLEFVLSQQHPSSWLGLLAAGWWCGAGGHGACCARCLLAAYVRAPSYRRRLPLLSLAAILHKQSKLQDAKDVAYILFYISPKSAIGAFLVAVSHSYLGEYEQAVWMYRYALSFDETFMPAKACMHATMCLMWMRENGQGNKLSKLN